MLLRRLLLLIVTLAAVAGLATATPASAGGAFATGQQRNLFAELLGKTNVELQAKIDTAWQQLFYGNDETHRIYYPVGVDMAYIADIGNGDIRSEGMSYGMMIAVQLDKRAEFDRLWKWAKTYMYHADGPRRGYFAWQCRFDGTQIDPGSASDGEEWFTMALLFAANRWPKTAGSIDYAAEAQSLLDEMRRDNRGGNITAIFDLTKKQVVFAPTADGGSAFTDPSYHLPAFYELWARWDHSADGRRFWSEIATTSRDFLRQAAHPKTGLMPEYANFDGTPVKGDQGDFRYDARRILANVALDHAWFAADPWQVEQSNRVLSFLKSQGNFCPALYTLEGRPFEEGESVGLFAMAAVAGLAADGELARPFLQRLWEAPIPKGKWRYYDGLLYSLALLEAGGRFKIYLPPPGK